MITFISVIGLILTQVVFWFVFLPLWLDYGLRNMKSNIFVFIFLMFLGPTVNVLLSIWLLSILGVNFS